MAHGVSASPSGGSEEWSFKNHDDLKGGDCDSIQKEIATVGDLPQPPPPCPQVIPSQNSFTLVLSKEAAAALSDLCGEPGGQQPVQQGDASQCRLRGGDVRPQLDLRHLPRRRPASRGR